MYYVIQKILIIKGPQVILTDRESATFAGALNIVIVDGSHILKLVLRVQLLMSIIRLAIRL